MGEVSQTQTCVNQQTRRIEIAAQFFRFGFVSNIFFGLATLPLTKSQLQRLDVTQRKMLRTIVGWAVVDSTDWKTTMQRMNEKLDAALRLYPISPWSDAVFRKQFHLSARVCRHLDRSHFFGILLTMPNNILQTNLFENVDAHKCDGMTTSCGPGTCQWYSYAGKRSGGIVSRTLCRHGRFGV